MGWDHLTRDDLTEKRKNGRDLSSDGSGLPLSNLVREGVNAGRAA
jgi:hypothetical protein